jgi:hypothetical protein
MERQILSDDRDLPHKIQFCVEVKFVNSSTVDGVVEEETKTWHVSNTAVEYSSDFLIDGASTLDEKIANFCQHGSGWSVQRLISLQFIFLKINQLSSLSGHAYIPTPEALKTKQCFINVNNTDKYCFLYAILSLLKYDCITDRHRNRPSKYKDFFSELNFKDSDYPMCISNISKFEHSNNVSVNVLGYDTGLCSSTNDSTNPKESHHSHSYFLYYRSKYNYPSVCNLLLLQDGNNFHYVGITNLDRLLNSNLNKFTSRTWCHSCLRSFDKRAGSYEKHLPQCQSQQSADTFLYKMPAPGSIMEFTQWQKTISPVYSAYCDFESLLRPSDESGKVQQHEPIAAGCLFMSNYPNLQNTLDYDYQNFVSNDQGDNCVIKFLQHLERLATEVKLWYRDNSNKPMTPLSQNEELLHISQPACYMCKKQFSVDRTRVHDHDHLTGDYLGAACNTCNLQRRIKYPFLPVVFHNLRGYDLHHVMKYAINQFPHWNLSCIPNTSEKFLSLNCQIPNAVSLRFLILSNF